jgi:hypothetical protein
MKRLAVPFLLFAGAFLSTFLLQRYTFIWQESDGLFLATGDYISRMFRPGLHVGAVLGDFLSQFFRYSLYAPFIVGACVTLVFLMVRGIFRRFRLDMDLPAAMAACALWLAVAFAEGPSLGASVFLYVGVLWLLTRFLPVPAKKVGIPFWVDLVLSAACIGGCFIFLACSGKVRSRETVAEVRYHTSLSDWDSVLAVATPAAAVQDPGILAPALLALGEKGLLGERLFSYDVRSEDDLDMVDQGDSYESLFFRSFLYSTLGCPSEAVHNLSQLATLQPHGTSFLVLRALIMEHFRSGDYGLAAKYCSVLERSTLNKAYVKYFREQMLAGTPAPRDSVEFRKNVPLITHDPFYNLYLLQGRAANQRAVLDRILCTLLLRGNIDGFHTMLMSSPYASGVLPKHYQEALVMGGFEHEGVTPAVMERYVAFQSDLLGLSQSAAKDRYADTFWMYMLFHSQQ